PAIAPWHVPLPAGGGDSGRNVRRSRDIPASARFRRPSGAQAECKRSAEADQYGKLISWLSRLPRTGPPSREMAAHGVSPSPAPPPHGALPPASRLFFDMACRILGRAHGR